MTATVDSVPVLTDPALGAPAGACREASWRQLFERHQPRLFRLALRRTGNADDAHDVVQDVFLSAFRHVDGLRHDAAVPVWLRRITINRCNDLRRHQRRRPTQSLDALGAEQDLPAAALVPAQDLLDPGARCDDHAARESLRRTIAELSDRLRPVATLRFLHERRLDEIGELLGLSLGTVKSRLHRARTALLAAEAMAPWLAAELEPARCAG